jgi:glucose/arabinose dehydrogenase
MASPLHHACSARMRAAIVCASIAMAASVSCIDDNLVDFDDDDEQVDPEPVNRVGLQLVADGLVNPVLLVSSGDGTARRFIVDRIGLVRIATSRDEVLDEPFLDLRDAIVRLEDDYDERGLLGLAFHPAYETNGKLYIYYSAPLRRDAPEGYDHTARLSELTVSDPAANRVDPTSERILLEIDQPQANHNGGSVAFGPDGFLYLSLGDGGEANDVGLGHPPLGNGQDARTLLGSILRIDVDHGDPYAVPADNPYVGREGADEIFAHGFRNPYRMSFDLAGSRELFVSDAGQNRWEEIDLVTRGGNYGWNVREGTHCFDRDDADQEPASCPTVGWDGEPLIDPIVEYQNANVEGGLGVVVVGGYVYRGTAMPGLAGDYVFGDFSATFDAPQGRIFAASASDDDDGTFVMRELTVEGRDGEGLGAYLLGFGQDDLGDVYVLVSEEPGPTGRTGRVYRLVPGTRASEP